MQLRLHPFTTRNATHTRSPTAVVVQGELVPFKVSISGVHEDLQTTTSASFNTKSDGGGDMVAADRVEQAAPPAGAAPRFARLKATQKHGNGWGYMSDNFWRDHKGNSDTPPRDWGTGGQ